MWVVAQYPDSLCLVARMSSIIEGFRDMAYCLANRGVTACGLRLSSKGGLGRIKSVHCRLHEYGDVLSSSYCVSSRIRPLSFLVPIDTDLHIKGEFNLRMFELVRVTHLGETPTRGHVEESGGLDTGNQRRLVQ